MEIVQLMLPKGATNLDKALDAAEFCGNEEVMFDVEYPIKNASVDINLPRQSV